MPAAALWSCLNYLGRTYRAEPDVRDNSQGQLCDVASISVSRNALHCACAGCPALGGLRSSLKSRATSTRRVQHAAPGREAIPDKDA